MKRFYEHKQHRLKNYNYSSNGSYFLTIYVKNKECLLGDIVAVDAHGDCVSDAHGDCVSDAHGDCVSDAHSDLTAQGNCVDRNLTPQVVLSEYGSIAEKYILSGNTAYKNLTVDTYVIMPNHIHIILSVCNEDFICREKSCHDLIPSYVSTLKTLITKEIGFPIFQRTYHDRVIRNEKEYEKIWHYIDRNPTVWAEDCFYI